MVDSEKLMRYIAELENHIRHALELQKIDRQEFVSNWKVYELAERKMHLIFETFLSIGEMIISEFNFRRPDFYAEIPQILCENGVISQELSNRLSELAKFRNVLAHEYITLDHERAYEHLQTDIVIVEEFLRQIKEYLRGKI